MLRGWIISSLFKAFSRCSRFQHLGILKVTFFFLSIFNGRNGREKSQNKFARFISILEHYTLCSVYPLLIITLALSVVMWVHWRMEWGLSCSLSPQQSSSIPSCFGCSAPRRVVLAASREGTAASREGDHPGTYTSETHQKRAREKHPPYSGVPEQSINPRKSRFNDLFR